jgi:hypothetical protein
MHGLILQSMVLFHKLQVRQHFCSGEGASGNLFQKITWAMPNLAGRFLNSIFRAGGFAEKPFRQEPYAAKRCCAD